LLPTLLSYLTDAARRLSFPAAGCYPESATNWRRDMYCPQCGVEYRDGFTQCADCHVALVPVLAPAAPEPQVEPVMVFESSDRFAISLAKGSLEESGIPFWMQGGENYTELVSMIPIMFPSCRFLVPKEHEAEARELLALLESPIEDQGAE